MNDKQLNNLFYRARTKAALDTVRAKIRESGASPYMMQRLLRRADRREWDIVAESRTGDEWLVALAKITDLNTRAQVASIVFFDHAPKCKALYPFLALYKAKLPYDEKRVFAGLLAVGFPEFIARERCKRPETSYDVP